MNRLMSVFFALALVIGSAVGRAQSPIDFHRIAIPPVLAGDWSIVNAANVFGSPHEEIIRSVSNIFEIVDVFTNATPTTLTFSVVGTVNSVAVADYDANGTMDVAALDYLGIEMIRQPASQVFSETYAVTSTNPVHAADLDQDGDIDMVVAGTRWMNDGTGTSFQQVSFAIGAASSIDVAPGDVDGDGDMDLIATFIGSSASGPGLVSRIHRQNADHSFTLFGGQRLVPNATSGITKIEDMNGDGKADVVFVSLDPAPSYDTGSHATIGQWLGTTASSTGFTATPSLESTALALPREIAVADLDGDGRKDLIAPVATFINGDYYSVLSACMTTAGGALAPATGRSLSRVGFQGVADPLGVAAVDADLDGRPDLFVGPAADNIALYRNDSAVAQPVSMMIAESIGPDYAWTANGTALVFGLVDAGNGEVLNGVPLTLTMALPAGGTLTSTHTMGHRTRFNLPAPFPTQPVPITVSAPGGWSQTFNVHTAPSFAGTTGGGQSAPLGQPFANPVTTSLIDGQGQPLRGVRIEVPPGSVATPTQSSVYTDANGSATLPIVAGPAIGSFYLLLHAFDEECLDAVALTTLGDTLTLDATTPATACIGQTITISGHLNDAFGAPRAAAAVTLHTQNISAATASTLTAADGSFTFTATTPVQGPASWSVTSPSAPQSQPGGAIAVAPVTITLDGGASQSVCTGSPFLPITGHISNSCGMSVSGITVILSVSGNLGLSFPSLSTLTSAQGTFSFQPTVVNPPAGSSIATIEIDCAGAPQPASAALIYTNGILTAASGDQQLCYAGAAFAQPLVVSSGGICGFAQGTPVTFSTATLGVTFSPATAVIDANGDAITTVSTNSGAVGPVVVHAAIGIVGVDFHLYVRRLRVINSPPILVINYQHEHPNVPLVLAADSPQTPPLTTPWGTIYTSILAPGPSFGALDGLGITGKIDPGMTTGTTGLWNRPFLVSVPLGLTFVGQMYGYDLNAAFPFEYIVSNPITISF